MGAPEFSVCNETTLKQNQDAVKGDGKGGYLGIHVSQRRPHPLPHRRGGHPLDPVARDRGPAQTQRLPRHRRQRRGAQLRLGLLRQHARPRFRPLPPGKRPLPGLHPAPGHPAHPPGGHEEAPPRGHERGHAGHARTGQEVRDQGAEGRDPRPGRAAPARPHPAHPGLLRRHLGHGQTDRVHRLDAVQADGALRGALHPHLRTDPRTPDPVFSRLQLLGKDRQAELDEFEPTVFAQGGA